MEEIELLLKQKGIRPTAMRLLVYDLLQKKDIAIALSDLEDSFEKADRTTLYRTLKTFEEKGVVHGIDDGTGTYKYALCEAFCKCDISKDFHLHFHCIKCKKTVCLTDYKIPSVNLPKGYIAESINLVIKGNCPLCK